VVGRDGRDVFMSFLNHMRSMRPEFMMELAESAIADGIELDGLIPPVDDVHEFFAWWLYEQPMWFEHVASFWNHYGEPNVLFVHYDDMKADLRAEMRRVAAFLVIEFAESLWPEVIERCTFDAMKRRSEQIGDLDRAFVGGADTFLYKGTNGRRRDVLTADEIAAFHRRSAELLPREAIAWTTGRS
jgi:aryl sulfotransferase